MAATPQPRRVATLRPDLIAGIVTACVVIPQAIAYAGIAGLPAQVGLYVAFVPMIAYAFIGTSRVLSVSTTSTLSVITASAIALTTDSVAAAAMLALLTGVLLAAAGFARAGFLANLVSAPILAGFKAGTGIVIIVGQLGKLLGIPVNGDTIIDKLADIIRGLDDINGPTLALGAGTIALLVILRHIAPRIPGPLIAVAAGIALVAGLDLAEHGVAVIGAVPAGLPTPKWPSFDDWRQLVPATLGLALLAFVESLAAGRSLRRHDEPPIDPNRELIALGAANITAGLFRGFPAGGGLSQSAVNAQAGARSTTAGLTTAAAAAIVMISLTGILDDLAQATLGALVIVAASALLKPGELLRITRIRRRDGILGIVALAGVVFLGVLQGILIAVVTSLAVLAAQSRRTPLEALIPSEDGGIRPAQPGEPRLLRPGLLALRLRGTLAFTNADHITTLATNDIDNCQPTPTVVLLDFVAVPELEVTALDAIQTLANDIRDRGAHVWLCGLDPAIADMVDQTNTADQRFPTIAAALHTYQPPPTPHT